MSKAPPLNQALSKAYWHKVGLAVQAVLTDIGWEFCGRDDHPYELYLALNDIEHRRTQVRRPQTNGFVERFQLTVLDEFFRTAFRTTLYETVEALQTDLDALAARLQLRTATPRLS